MATTIMENLQPKWRTGKGSMIDDDDVVVDQRTIYDQDLQGTTHNNNNNEEQQGQDDSTDLCTSDDKATAELSAEDLLSIEFSAEEPLSIELSAIDPLYIEPSAEEQLPNYENVPLACSEFFGSDESNRRLSSGSDYEKLIPNGTYRQNNISNINNVNNNNNDGDDDDDGGVDDDDDAAQNVHRRKLDWTYVNGSTDVHCVSSEEEEEEKDYEECYHRYENIDTNVLQAGNRLQPVPDYENLTDKQSDKQSDNDILYPALVVSKNGNGNFQYLENPDSDADINNVVTGNKEYDFAETDTDKESMASGNKVVEEYGEGQEFGEVTAGESDPVGYQDWSDDRDDKPQPNQVQYDTSKKVEKHDIKIAEADSDDCDDNDHSEGIDDDGADCRGGYDSDADVKHMELRPPSPLPSESRDEPPSVMEEHHDQQDIAISPHHYVCKNETDDDFNEDDDDKLCRGDDDGGDYGSRYNKEMEKESWDDAVAMDVDGNDDNDQRVDDDDNEDKHGEEKDDDDDDDDSSEVEEYLKNFVSRRKRPKSNAGRPSDKWVGREVKIVSSISAHDGQHHRAAFQKGVHCTEPLQALEILRTSYKLTDVARRSTKSIWTSVDRPKNITAVVEESSACLDNTVKTMNERMYSGSSKLSEMRKRIEVREQKLNDLTRKIIEGRSRSANEKTKRRGMEAANGDVGATTKHQFDNREESKTPGQKLMSRSEFGTADVITVVKEEIIMEPAPKKSKIKKKTNILVKTFRSIKRKLYN